MAQSITSVLNKNEILATEVASADVLYLIHGTGSNRDRFIKFAELIAYISGNTNFHEIKIIKDADTDISIKWDSQNEEFVIWDRTNSNGHVVAVPKLKVYGTLAVENDAFANKNLTVEKKLTVKENMQVNNSAVFYKDIRVAFNSTFLAGLNVNGGQLKTERLNLGSAKSYFEISSDTNINTLLANTTIEVFTGDIVVLYNTSANDVTVTLSIHNKIYDETTLNKKCAMQFICVKTDEYVAWAPLGSATVTSRIIP